MPISDVLDALEGFAGAYNKVAAREVPIVRHELRLSAVEASSFGLVVIAYAVLNDFLSAAQTAETVAGAARWVFERIAAVVAAKKHTGGENYTVNVNGDNNRVVIVTNSQGVDHAMTPEDFELFRARLIDPDLNKIVRPLEPEEVDAVQLRAEGDGEPLEETITREQRESFRQPESTLTIRETEVTGTLVSLNKESNRGTFRLGNGKNVQYRYVGSDADRFHREFALRGDVRVRGEAMLDENLTPVSLTISSLERVQLVLPALRDEPPQG